MEKKLFGLGFYAGKFYWVRLLITACLDIFSAHATLIFSIFVSRYTVWEPLAYKVIDFKMFDNFA